MTGERVTGKYYDLDIPSTVLLPGYGKSNLQSYLSKAKTENRILWVSKKNHQNQASPGVQFSNAILSGDYTDNLTRFKQIVKNEFTGTIFQNTFDENGERLFSSRNVQQTLEDYRYQRDVEFKAMKAVYDAERSQIEQAHRREMQALEDSYRGEAAKASEKFVQLMRECMRREFQNKERLFCNA